MESIAATQQPSALEASPRRGARAVRLPVRGSESARVLAIAIPVIAAGAAALLAAIWSFVASEPSASLLVGVAALLVVSCLAEAFPVPLEPAGYVSLAAIFIVGAGVTYGWAPAVVIAVFTGAAIELVDRKPFVRLAYNSAVYGLGGGAAGYAAHSLPHSDRVETLLLEVLAGASAFYVVNMVLTSVVIARCAGDPALPRMARNLVGNAGPFAIMASVALMLVVLWRESPLLLAALVGPLVSVALYQRSVDRAMKAMRLALTDAQTGLGNKRHFEELLQRYLDRADADGSPLTLLLADVDDFKTVNDTYGHPIGDCVLSQVADRLRRGGESFRLGGDEFALLLPGRDVEEGRAIAESVARRIAEARYDHGGQVSVSIGVASYPQPGVERSELVRAADRALYAAKGDGKARVRVYRPGERLA